jgi:hypothetical protein
MWERAGISSATVGELWLSATGRESKMKFLIQWKDSKEEEVHRFGVLNEGEIEPNAQP